MADVNVIFGGGGSKSPAISMWSDPGAEISPVAISHFPKGYSIYALAVSPCATRLAAGTKGGLLRVHALSGHRATENAAALFEVFHPPAVVSLAFCTDDILCSGGLDGRIRVWSVSEKRQRAEISAHGGGVFALCSLGSLVVASIGGDGVLRVWDMDSLEAKFESEPFALPRVQALTTLVHYARSGLLMHPSRTGDLHVHDVRSGFTRRLVAAHRGDFCALACGGEHVVTGGLDEPVLRVWALAPESPLMDASTGGGIIAAAWAGSETVMAVSQDGSAQIWRVDGALTQGPHLPDHDFRSCAGLPSEMISRDRVGASRRWRDERVAEARRLLTSSAPADQRKIAAVVEELRDRGFSAEATLVLADAGRAQERLLWELESRMALVEGLGEDEVTVPSLFALGDLLERLQEPGLARECFEKVIRIAGDSSDARRRAERLKDHPLVALSPEEGVRGDFAQPEHVLQELEKCMTLRKKFQWRVVIETKPPSEVRTRLDLGDLCSVTLEAVAERRGEDATSEIRRVRPFDGVEIREVLWAILTSPGVGVGLACALEVRPTLRGCEVVFRGLFDTGSLGIPETTSPAEHNDRVRKAWLSFTSSSDAKRWLADMHHMTGGAAKRLESRVIAQVEDEF